MISELRLETGSVRFGPTKTTLAAVKTTGQTLEFDVAEKLVRAEGNAVSVSKLSSGLTLRLASERSRSHPCHPRAWAASRSLVLNSTDRGNHVGLCILGSTPTNRPISRCTPNSNVVSFHEGRNRVGDIDRSRFGT